MSLSARDWNRALTKAKSQSKIIDEKKSAATGKKYLYAINESETETIDAFDGVFIYWDIETFKESENGDDVSETIEIDNLELVCPPYRIHDRSLNYSQIFFGTDKVKFLEIGVSQDIIGPGEVGRIQIAGVTVAKTYNIRIVDHGHHNPAGLDFTPEDYPFCGLRQDRIFSPYVDSPQSGRLLGRPVAIEAVSAEIAQIETEPDRIIYDYGVIVLPVFIAR